VTEVEEVLMDEIEFFEVHELEADDQVTSHQVLVKPLEGLVDYEGHVFHDELCHLGFFTRLNCILHKGESDEHNEETDLNPVPGR
jgi:hypothetical protein